MPLTQQQLNNVFYNIVNRALTEYEKGNKEYIYLRNLDKSSGKHLRIPIIFNEQLLLAVWSHLIKNQEFIGEKTKNKRENEPVFFSNSLFNISNDQMKLLILNDHLKLLAGQFFAPSKKIIENIKIYQSNYEVDARFKIPGFDPLKLEFFCLLIPQEDIASLSKQIKEKGASLSDKDLQSLIIEQAQENINNFLATSKTIEQAMQNLNLNEADKSLFDSQIKM